jgi:hypothetical protein
VLWTIGVRDIARTASSVSLALYFALAVGGLTLSAIGTLLNLVVTGGATRNLVTHLLWNEPFSVRTTYRNVSARFWSLLGATLIVGLIVSGTLILVGYLWILGLGLAVGGAGLLSTILPVWFVAGVGIIAAVAVTGGALWLFFLIVGRFAYVPQVIMVEGRSVSAAISRSSSLASRNAQRLAAITIFDICAAYSALMILIVPLGWYGYLNGINPFLLRADQWPAWYAISYNMLGQISSILLLPIWMLGLSLLYVDERVRQEGYDIELMAARQLGAMPQLNNVTSPLAPAIVAQTSKRATAMDEAQTHAAREEAFPNSILGLR